MKNKQTINGNNNIQVGVNNGKIIHTKTVRHVTEVLYDPESYITDAQALKIKEKITELVEMLAASNNKTKAALFKQEYSALYRQFRITGYKLLPKDRFQDALSWLQKRIAYKGKKVIKRSDTETWRNLQYKAIYARSRNLGMDKKEVLEYAGTIFPKIAPIASLKDLSDKQLQSLYNSIFNM